MNPARRTRPPVMEMHRLVAAFAGVDVPTAADFDTLDTSCAATEEYEAIATTVSARLRALAGMFGYEAFYRDVWLLLLYLRVYQSYSKFIERQVSKIPALRLATARRFVEDVEATHERIDQLATRLDPDDSRSGRSRWRDQLQSDQTSMLTAFGTNADNPLYLVKGWPEEKALEVLATLKYEIDYHSGQHSAELTRLQRAAFSAIVRSSKIRVPKIPSFFVLKDDMVVADSIDNMENAELRYFRASISSGIWTKRTQVVAKQIVADPVTFCQREFIKAAETWAGLHHRHVVKLCGVSHICSPAIVALEDTVTTTFLHYFNESEENKRRFWRMFHEAALGVQYLHHKGIKHGALRCCNIAVSADDTTKICDFVEHEMMRNMKGGSPANHTIRWKAPECAIANGPDPSFAADVYALALCILEAWTSEPPFGLKLDDDIADLYQERRMHERPRDFPDAAWSVIEHMCAFNPEKRATIDEVVERLHELAEEEMRENAMISTVKETTA